MITINPNTPTARIIEQAQQFSRTHPWLFSKAHSLAPVRKTPLMDFAQSADNQRFKELK